MNHRLHKVSVEKVNYRGIIMEAGVGISIEPKQVKAITDWKFSDLTNKTALRSVPGLCNHVQMFIHHASEIAEPLNCVPQNGC